MTYTKPFAAALTALVIAAAGCGGDDTADKLERQRRGPPDTARPGAGPGDVNADGRDDSVVGANADAPSRSDSARSATFSRAAVGDQPERRRRTTDVELERTR